MFCSLPPTWCVPLSPDCDIMCIACQPSTAAVQIQHLLPLSPFHVGSYLEKLVKIQWIPIHIGYLEGNTLQEDEGKGKQDSHSSHRYDRRIHVKAAPPQHWPHATPPPPPPHFHPSNTAFPTHNITPLKCTCLWCCVYACMHVR